MEELETWSPSYEGTPQGGIMSPLLGNLQLHFVQGVWSYYGVIGNSERLWDYAWNAKRLVFKWLNHRSQRRSDTWTMFEGAWQRWEIPSPLVYEKPWPRAGQAQTRRS